MNHYSRGWSGIFSFFGPVGIRVGFIDFRLLFLEVLVTEIHGGSENRDDAEFHNNTTTRLYGLGGAVGRVVCRGAGGCHSLFACSEPFIELGGHRRHACETLGRVDVGRLAPERIEADVASRLGWRPFGSGWVDTGHQLVKDDADRVEFGQLSGLAGIMEDLRCGVAGRAHHQAGLF